MFHMLTWVKGFYTASEVINKVAATAGADTCTVDSRSNAHFIFQTIVWHSELTGAASVYNITFLGYGEPV